LDGRPVKAGEVQAMCSVLAHRGPDEEGLFVGTGAGLGMRRLSIIDLETGQPAADGRGSGDLGGLQRRESTTSRAAPGADPHAAIALPPRSDAETIVHLYEDLGAACVERLRGMFAFAVWTRGSRAAPGARSAGEIKPLYYTQIGDRILFGSELKAILEHPTVERRLSGRRSATCSPSSRPPRPEHREGIRKLEPGHLLQASAGSGVRIRRYWELRFEPDTTATRRS